MPHSDQILAARGADVGEEPMGVGVARPQRDGALEVRDGLVDAALLRQDRAHPHPRDRVVGRERDRRPKLRLSVGKAAGAGQGLAIRNSRPRVVRSFRDGVSPQAVRTPVHPIPVARFGREDADARGQRDHRNGLADSRRRNPPAAKQKPANHRRGNDGRQRQVHPMLGGDFRDDGESA